MGNYRCAYPAKNPEQQGKYEMFLEEARMAFNDFTSSHTHKQPALHDQYGFRANQMKMSQADGGAAGTNPNTNNNVGNASFKISHAGLVAADKAKAAELMAAGRDPPGAYSNKPQGLQ
jgi:hypothetical protein